MKNIQRLKIKESDRVESTIALLNSFGINAESDGANLIVYGGQTKPAVIDSYNDHRIAMSACIASQVCKDKVVIENAEAVKKSYPHFFDDMKKLGFDIELEN